MDKTYAPLPPQKIQYRIKNAAKKTANKIIGTPGRIKNACTKRMRGYKAVTTITIIMWGILGTSEAAPAPHISAVNNRDGFIATPNAPITAFGESIGEGIFGGATASLIFDFDFKLTCKSLEDLKHNMHTYAKYNKYKIYWGANENIPAQTLDQMKHKLSSRDYELTTKLFKRANLANMCAQLELMLKEKEFNVIDFYEKTEEGKKLAPRREALLRRNARTNQQGISPNPRHLPNYRGRRDEAAEMQEQTGSGLRQKREPGAILLGSIIVSLVLGFSLAGIQQNVQEAERDTLIKVAKTNWEAGKANKQLAEVIRDLERHMQAETDHIRAMARIDTALDLAQRNIESTIRVLDQASMGVFSIETLIDFDIRKAQAELTRKAEERNLEVLPTAAAQWGSSMATFLSTKNGVKISLTVPLFDASNKMTIYKFAHVATLKVEETFGKIAQHSYDYVGISANGLYWKPLSAAELLACHKMSGAYVCADNSITWRTLEDNKQAPVQGRSDAWCLYGLFKKNVPMIKRHCQLEKSDGQSIDQVSSVSVLIGSPDKRATAIITCPTGVARGGSIILHTNEVVTLNPECYLETEGYRINPTFSAFFVEDLSLHHARPIPLEMLRDILDFKESEATQKLKEKINKAVADAADVEQMAKQVYEEAEDKLGSKHRAWNIANTVAVGIVYAVVAWQAYSICKNKAKIIEETIPIVKSMAETAFGNQKMDRKRPGHRSRSPSPEDMYREIEAEHNVGRNNKHKERAEAAAAAGPPTPPNRGAMPRTNIPTRNATQ